MKNVKRYWWIAPIIVCLIFIPKVIDWLFSVDGSTFTALDRLDASDILGYVGSVIGGTCALIAIIVAITHFNIEKRPLIVPRNKRFFYYLNFCGRQAFMDDADVENDLERDIDTPLVIAFENVTDNAAISFGIEIDYNDGQYYRNICDLIGGEPNDVLDWDKEAEKYPNQGACLAKARINLQIPTGLELTVKGICYRLSERTVDVKERALRYNNFIRKQYKIAELNINARDISGKEAKTVYDIVLSLSHTLVVKSDYDIRFSFVLQEK